LPFVGGLDQFVHQLRGGDVADPAALFARGQAEGDEEVAFAGAGIAQQDDGLAGVHVGAGGQRGEGRGLDGGHRVDVELTQTFEPGELGFGDAAGASAFGPVVDLSSEDLRQEGEMGLSLAHGHLGQPGGSGADGRQVQFAGGGADRGLCGVIAACTHLALPVSRSS
jgi:hypothetical protein